MGSFFCGLILFVPLFFGMKKLVLSYRSGLEERINKWRIVQILKNNKLVLLCQKIRDMGGA